MKRTILLHIIFVFSLINFSCDKKYPCYEYSIQNQVPDSNQKAHREYIVKLVSAASYHMSGGDYEDPEDLLSEAEFLSYRVYSVEVEGLVLKRSKDDWQPLFIPFHKLNQQQRIYFDSLKVLK